MSSMQQRALTAVALAAGSVFAVAVAQAQSPAQPTNPAEKKTGYAPVNGLKRFACPLPGHCRRSAPRRF
jgi:hypothetical protein